MMSLEQFRRRLAEKGYRNRQLEALLRRDGAASSEGLERQERILAADFDGVFLAWFGEAKYKAHLRRALIEKAEGGIGELIDHVRRLE